MRRGSPGCDWRGKDTAQLLTEVCRVVGLAERRCWLVAQVKSRRVHTGGSPQGRGSCERRALVVTAERQAVKREGLPGLQGE